MKSPYLSVLVKPGREKSILHHHPWVYSGAIQKIEGTPKGGETVDLINHRGEFLARGAYSPESKIRIRIWTWDPKTAINRDYINRVLEKAVAFRKNSINLQTTNAYRLVHGESDNFPGLIVDCYHNLLVMQCLSYGAEAWRETITESLLQLTKATGIYERSDVDIRTLEGLPLQAGPIAGEGPFSNVVINENGLEYYVDIVRGQKTGFFLDQRQNRLAVRQLSQGKQVLDCFCYTGGFSIAALAGNAQSVVGCDVSEEAIDMGKKQVALNHLDQNRISWVNGDVFVILRGMRDRDQKFDMIILDPPKFASSVSQVEKAARGYKDINLLAMKLLRPGGYLVTFSCSGSVSADLFQKIVAGAALDAGVDAQIVTQLHQAEDHPILLSFPEGAYLKGLILEINK
jgi:23S rRNA (cytosine1962-C5)-methyltransferase